MLIIRKEQLRSFEEERLRDWILESVLESRPPEIAALEADDLREVVFRAIAAGRSFGLHIPDDLLRWARLTVRLGADFRSNPRCAWVREFLDDWDPDLGARVVRLEEAALERLAAPTASRP